MNDAPIGEALPLGLIAEAVNADVGIVYCYSEVIETRRSTWQTVQVLDTPAFGRVLRLDGVTMTSERDEFIYHENLVHVPAVAHRQPKDVAIIGGGDGGALREVLKHRCVERVDLVELDPSVVELSSKHLSAIHRGAFRDPRVTLRFAEGRSWLQSREEQYDLLLLDLIDPVGAAHDLYTAEFYELCRQRLHAGGIVGLHVQSPIARPRSFSRIVQTLRSIFAEVRPYLVFVPTYGTWFAVSVSPIIPSRKIENSSPLMTEVMKWKMESEVRSVRPLSGAPKTQPLASARPGRAWRMRWLVKSVGRSYIG